MIESNPIALIDRVKVPEARPRGVDPARVDRILAVIPKRNLRDRVLFTLIARTGVRASEALGVHVEDLTSPPTTNTSPCTAKAAGPTPSCSTTPPWSR